MKPPKRKKITPEIETKVLTQSKRKCAICVAIEGNYNQCNGQIAHLDKNNQNNNFDNLCWLCLKHHSEYDTITSQHKNYQLLEVKGYRDELYRKLQLKDYDLTLSNKDNTSKIEFYKPYNIEFNGVNGFFRTILPLTSLKSNFILEFQMRLLSYYHQGILFILYNSKTFEHIKFVKYSSENAVFKGKIVVSKYIKSKYTEVISFNEDLCINSNFQIVFSNKSLNLRINETDINLPFNADNFEFDLIDFCGTNAPFGQYISSILNFVRVFIDNELISNLDLHYGRQYLLKTQKEKYCFYGGSIEHKNEFK